MFRQAVINAGGCGILRRGEKTFFGKCLLQNLDEGADFGAHETTRTVQGPDFDRRTLLLSPCHQPTRGNVLSVATFGSNWSPNLGGRYDEPLVPQERSPDQKLLGRRINPNHQIIAVLHRIDPSILGDDFQLYVRIGQREASADAPKGCVSKQRRCTREGSDPPPSTAAFDHRAR
jgi:hypothetical protein